MALCERTDATLLAAGLIPAYMPSASSGQKMTGPMNASHSWSSSVLMTPSTPARDAAVRHQSCFNRWPTLARVVHNHTSQARLSLSSYVEQLAPTSSKPCSPARVTTLYMTVPIWPAQHIRHIFAVGVGNKLSQAFVDANPCKTIGREHCWPANPGPAPHQCTGCRCSRR